MYRSHASRSQRNLSTKRSKIATQCADECAACFGKKERGRSCDLASSSPDLMRSITWRLRSRARSMMSACKSSSKSKYLTKSFLSALRRIRRASKDCLWDVKERNSSFDSMPCSSSTRSCGSVRSNEYCTRSMIVQCKSCRRFFLGGSYGSRATMPYGHLAYGQATRLCRPQGYEPRRLRQRHCQPSGFFRQVRRGMCIRRAYCGVP